MEPYHQLLLKWLISAVLVVFGIAAAIYFDLAKIIIFGDVSMISVAIIAIFIVVSIYLGVRSVLVSKQINLANEVKKIIQKYDYRELKYTINDNSVYVCNDKLPDCLLVDHIKNLIEKTRIFTGNTIDQTLLLNNFSNKVHDKNAIGWMASKKMTSLGLLGTVIGFAIALTALFGITSFDFSAMKTILSNVAVGMAIALYTTITAIAASMPVEIKSYFIERGNNHLISLVTEITEVYVVPVLEKNNHVSKSNKK